MRDSTASQTPSASQESAVLSEKAGAAPVTEPVSASVETAAEPGRKRGHAVLVYALTLCLLALLESERLSGFLERLELPGAAESSRMVRSLASLSGAELVARAEARLLGQMTTAEKIGAVGLTAQMVAESDVPPLSPWQKTSSTPAPSSEPVAPATPSAHIPFSADGISSDPVVPAPVVPAPVVPAPVVPVPMSPDAAGTSVPPDPAVPPAPSGPPKVLIVGDSLIMEGLGPSLLRTLRARGDLTVVREGRYSTGLTRTDTFDWPNHMRTLVAAQKPDIVIACLGANDAQDILLDGKRHIAGTESWQALYRQRADAFLTEATAGGAEVVWLGLPIMGSPTYEKRIRLIADLQAAACNNVAPLCRFQDGLPALADARGQYLSHGVNSEGKHVRLRYKDKIHVTEAGGQMMVDAAMPLLQEVIAPKLPPVPEQSVTAPAAVPEAVPAPGALPQPLAPPSGEPLDPSQALPLPPPLAPQTPEAPCQQ